MSSLMTLRQRLSQIPRCAVHDEFDKVSDLANHKGICDRLLLFLHNTSRALSPPPPLDHLSYLQAGPDIVEISRSISRIQAILPKLDCDKTSQAITTVTSVSDQIAQYQQKLAVASQYDDLCSTVLEQLLVEVSQGDAFLDVTHPFKEYKSTALESLVTSYTQDIPIYNESEQILYDAYLQVKNRVPMLLFAIRAAREQVAAMSPPVKFGSLFPELTKLVEDKLAQVESKFTTLNSNIEEFYSINVQPRLLSVVRNMLVESILACRRILVDAMDFEDKVALHKLCARAVHLARKHTLALTSDSNDLALYWARLNPQYERVLEFMELLQLVASGSTEVVEPRNKGLDLRISVGTHSVPFSVKRTPKRSGHTGYSQIPPVELFKDECSSSLTDGEYDEYDNATLVSKTPRVLLEVDFKPRSLQRLRSRIPRIVPNYIELGYPVIQKTSGPLRIPTISACHPVFQSPQKSASRPIDACHTRMDFSNVDAHYSQLRLESLRKGPLLTAESMLSSQLNAPKLSSSSHLLLRSPAMLDTPPSYVSTLRTPSMNSPLLSAVSSPLSVSTTPQYGLMNSKPNTRQPSYPLFMQSPVTPIDITERGLPRPNIKVAMERGDWYSL